MEEGSSIIDNKFFPGARRRLTLLKHFCKMNAQNEKRIRLDFEVPLDGESFVGMPHYVGEAYKAVSQLDNALNPAPLEVELEGVTIEFFPTERGRRAMLITGSTVRGLKVYRSKATNTQKQHPDVFLGFHVNAKGSSELNAWGYENMQATMWAEFTVTQASLNLNADEEQEDEDPQEAAHEAVKEAHDPEFQPARARAAKPRAN